MKKPPSKSKTVMVRDHGDPKEPTIFCCVCQKVVPAEGAVLGASTALAPLAHYCSAHRKGILSYEELFELDSDQESFGEY